MLREEEEERAWGRGTMKGDGDRQSDCERDRDATGWNEKAEGKNNKRVGKMEKVFNRWVFLPACSSLFCFITSALSSADSTVSVAEVVWRHWPGRELKNPLMSCSELLFRAKRRNLSGSPINSWKPDYWNDITSPDWAAQPLSLHFPTKICRSKPPRYQQK